LPELLPHRRGPEPDQKRRIRGQGAQPLDQVRLPRHRAPRGQVRGCGRLMSNSWTEGKRPLSVAILALGGEGGGVPAGAMRAPAESAGFEAQTTSVAGVAQRTGATVYYLEMLPPGHDVDGDDARPRVRETPVMSIFPTPGEVDVVIASE